MGSGKSAVSLISVEPQSALCPRQEVSGPGATTAGRRRHLFGCPPLQLTGHDQFAATWLGKLNSSVANSTAYCPYLDVIFRDDSLTGLDHGRILPVGVVRLLWQRWSCRCGSSCAIWDVGHTMMPDVAIRLLRGELAEMTVS